MRTVFEYCAADYEAYRPRYPQELYDFLIEESEVKPSSTIVDVGAGTGKGSAPMVTHGFHIIAVDASENMLRAAPKDIRADQICAYADQLPLASAIADLVVCAQAFHWFSTRQTLAEMHRILKSSGRLALFWNYARQDSKAHRVYEDLIKKYNRGYRCAYRNRDWGSIAAEGQLFAHSVQKSFDHRRTMSIAQWTGLARSSSYVQSIREPELSRFLEELRVQLEPLESLDIDYRTMLWLLMPTGGLT